MRVVESVSRQEIEHLVDQAKEDGVLFCSKTEYYAIRDGDKIVAIAGAIWSRHTAVMKNDYVMPEHRGRGFFKELLSYRLGVARHRRLREVTANCTAMSVRQYLAAGGEVVKKFANGITKVRIVIGVAS